MGADVRIIQLIRKTVWGEKNLSGTPEPDLNEYFVTDYFDIMRVEEGDMNAPFTSMLGILPEKESNDVDIAVHGFALYCSESMMEAEKGNRRCGNPFQVADKKMPFLSVMQVHITPEVMARMPEQKSAEWFTKNIYTDLQAAMREYAEGAAHKCEEFVFRIYKMVSVGDFAIVVRSADEEISFGISSFLRRRVSADRKIVLYKTFTIFTLGNEIIECNLDSQGNAKEDREDRFVLRCCYSNKYWSNREDVHEHLKKSNLSFDDKPYGLNGRYDLSVRVTRKQFLALLQDIRSYKKTGKRDSVRETGSADEQTVTDDIVKYMRYLMDNQYLSYINERYLIAQDENGNESVKNNISTVVLKKTAGKKEEFLDEKVTKLYQFVKEKYDDVHTEINRGVTYRKNIWYYMGLLGKQINLYYGISGFSDTRIYAAMLLEQIRVILSLINEYVRLYEAAEDEQESEEEGEKSAILNRLEDDIREAVCALDSYAQYIRSRNLQSLQTPNYNLESGMSLEKILIGYSEFIKTFMDFYPGWIKEESVACFPVVVPRLKERDVSVGRLFPKGEMNDWEKEKGIREKFPKNHGFSVIIISVPVIAKLGNVGTMVTSLIHEMAHQFRYESRKHRNDAVLKYLVHSIMREIVNDVILEIGKETGTVAPYYRFGKRMRKIFMDAYLEISYRNQDGGLEYSFQEAPFSNFEYCFKKDLYKSFGDWEKKDQLEDAFRVFLKELLQHYQRDDEQFLEAVQVMDELVEYGKQDRSSQNTDQTENADLYEKIVRCAFGLTWMCACKWREMESCYIWEKKGFKTWVDETDIKTAYEDIWCDVFPEDSLISSTDEDIANIYKNFFDFSTWIFTNCGNEEKAKAYYSEGKKQFLESTYEKLCQEWREETIQRDLLSDDNSTIALTGRAMGIDCNTEENFKFFQERMTSSVVKKLGTIFEGVTWRIRRYREETADIFMCNVMGLTPFGYLYQLASEWLSDRELPNQYYGRSQNVILFQWCLEEKDNKETGEKEKILSYSKYIEECITVVETLEKAMGTTFRWLIDNGSNTDQGDALKPLGESLAPLVWKEDEENEKKLFKLSGRIDELREHCGEAMNVYTNLSGKEPYEKLKIYDIVANMLAQLLVSASEHIKYLNDFKEIRDDFIRGADKLKTINQDMCRSDIGRKDENGYTLINRIGEFCQEMGRWQNEPYLLLESAEERQKKNICSIEFLLEMYYESKMRIVRQTGGEKWQ